MGVVPAVSHLPMGALWTQSAHNGLSLWSRVCGLALTGGVRKTWKRGPEPERADAVGLACGRHGRCLVYLHVITPSLAFW